MPPDMVVDALRPVEPPPKVVDPHPRYPDEESSFISYPPPLPEPGIVGSALGLYV